MVKNGSYGASQQTIYLYNKYIYTHVCVDICKVIDNIYNDYKYTSGSYQNTVPVNSNKVF